MQSSTDYLILLESFSKSFEKMKNSLSQKEKELWIIIEACTEVLVFFDNNDNHYHYYHMLSNQYNYEFSKGIVFNYIKNNPDLQFFVEYDDSLLKKWDKYINKKIQEKTNKQSKENNYEKNVKYLYFYFIEACLSLINKNYFLEIESIADKILGEALSNKYKEYGETRKFKEIFNEMFEDIDNIVDNNLSFNYKENLWDTVFSPHIKYKVFLSYAYDDKFYTLLLFNFALEKNVFLCVDWIINKEISKNGIKLKKILKYTLNKCDKLLFLRSISSEFYVKGSLQVRQWCSWEIGLFHLKNNGDKNSSILQLVDIKKISGKKDPRMKKNHGYKPTRKNELFLDGVSIVKDMNDFFSFIDNS